MITSKIQINIRDAIPKEALKLGRTKWYDSFTVRICKLEQEYKMERSWI